MQADVAHVPVYLLGAGLAGRSVLAVRHYEGYIVRDVFAVLCTGGRLMHQPDADRDDLHLFPAELRQCILSSGS